MTREAKPTSKKEKEGKENSSIPVAMMLKLSTETVLKRSRSVGSNGALIFFSSSLENFCNESEVILNHFYGSKKHP